MHISRGAKGGRESGRKWALCRHPVTSVGQGCAWEGLRGRRGGKNEVAPEPVRLRGATERLVSVRCRVAPRRCCAIGSLVREASLACGDRRFFVFEVDVDDALTLVEACG